MSPTDHRKALRPGEQRFEVLGTEVVVQFNDRELLRDVLSLYDRIRKLKTVFEGGGGTGDMIDATLVSLDMLDEADAIVTRAVGEATRSKLWSGSPIKEPLVALVALAEPAGVAYGALLEDFTPKD